MVDSVDLLGSRIAATPAAAGIPSEEGRIIDLRNDGEPGWGFVENVYSKPMQLELKEMQIQFDLESSVVVRYKGTAVGVFRADMIVEQCVLVELKSATTIAEAHEKQVLNYLNATNIEVALLLNFGPRPSFKRYLLTNNKKKHTSV